MTNQIKNFIDEGEKSFDKEFSNVIWQEQCIQGNYVLSYKEKEAPNRLKQFISSRQISLIKMIVDSCEASKRIELLKLRSCENDKLNWNYHQGKVHQLEDLLKELTDGK